MLHPRADARAAHHRRSARGRRRARRSYLAQTHDVGPTLLSLAGVARPKGMDGVDLSPLLRGRRPREWRKFAYGGYANWHYARTHELGVRREQLRDRPAPLRPRARRARRRTTSRAATASGSTRSTRRSPPRGRAIPRLSLTGRRGTRENPRRAEDSPELARCGSGRRARRPVRAARRRGRRTQQPERARDRGRHAAGGPRATATGRARRTWTR